MVTVRPPGTITLHDAGINLMEEPNLRGGVSVEWQRYENNFRNDVLAGVVRLMRQRGWHVHQDSDIVKNYCCLRKSHRWCIHRSGLECKIRQSGRCLEIKFYQNVTKPDHHAGGEYVYGKLKKMPYLLKQRCRLEIHHVCAWLINHCKYNVKSPEPECNAYGATAREWLDWRWEYKRFSGDKPKTDQEISDYNRKCIDGVVENGERVYYLNGYGPHRWGVGIAEHNINNMWWVKIGTHEITNICCHDMRHTPPPDGLKGRRIEERHRKNRLEKLMLKAAEERRYSDAERMRIALENKLYMV